MAMSCPAFLDDQTKVDDHHGKHVAEERSSLKTLVRLMAPDHGPLNRWLQNIAFKGIIPAVYVHVHEADHRCWLMWLQLRSTAG